MIDLLPNPRRPSVSQLPGGITKGTLDKLDQLIVIAPTTVPERVWTQMPDGNRLHALARRAGKSALLRSRLPNKAGTGVVAGRLPKPRDGGRTLSAFERLGFAGKLVAEALTDDPRSIGLLVVGIDGSERESIVRAVTLATLAHAFRMPAFTTPAAKARKLRTLKIIGLDGRIDLDRECAEAEALNLVRWLTTMPANKLDAKNYRSVLQELARANGWQFEFLGEAKLKKLGAGAFLAVSQGNATRDAGIVRLRYRPDAGAAKPSLALVGKGIVFDTGGNNLKPFKSMLDMHEDMCGSAVAVATLQALTRIGYPEPVDCWLAITENRIDAEAYKSRDVVTASNGVTIEVIHTDAEGRMVLADTLALAGKHQPKLIMDYATLTGACVYALTDRYSGVFTNKPALNPLLTETGAASGERVWPFPMDGDYDDDIKSKVADVVQCSVSGEGDQILAARFLQRFVPRNTAWVHMDLSAATRKHSLAQVPAGATGFGVRYTLNLLLEQSDRLQSLIGN